MLAIIPARAGSKGVPGKNKALIAGRPLVDYTVTALERARSVSGIILSTDDQDILALYRDRAGIFALDRPKRLAEDDTTTADVVAHALDAWQALGRDIPDALFVAQPITPLRTAADWPPEAACLICRSCGYFVFNSANFSPVASVEPSLT